MISTDNDDDGFTIEELNSIIQSLKEAVMIKSKELQSLSIADLWD